MTERANPDIARISGYFLLNLVTGLFWFCLLARAAASAEPAWVRAVLGVDIPQPYRELPGVPSTSAPRPS